MEYPTELHKLLKLSPDTAVVSAPVISLDLPPTPIPKVSYSTFSSKFAAVLHRLMKSNLMIYPIVFVVAFIFFYTILNFSSILNQVSGFFTKPQEAQILGDNLKVYYQWISGYYFWVNDNNLLDPNNDIDKDGLSNIDEFIMRTNPVLADSDQDGFGDGIEIINSYNPWGDGRMREDQIKLASSLDIIKINNRISFNVISQLPTQSNSNILGVSTTNFDLTRPGKLSIPKLNMQVPLIWTSDPKDFSTDLTRGVVHYPGTALPAQVGTMYVSGHSSDYLWNKHPYRQVFAKLNALEPGDDIFVDVYGLDGKLYNFRYQVVAENIYKPNDQAQFIDGSGAKLNLSTCWPIGTQKDRYVVSAILTNL